MFAWDDGSLPVATGSVKIILTLAELDSATGMLLQTGESFRAATIEYMRQSLEGSAAAPNEVKAHQKLLQIFDGVGSKLRAALTQGVFKADQPPIQDPRLTMSVDKSNESS